jgi:hypothetical protein
MGGPGIPPPIMSGMIPPPIPPHAYGMPPPPVSTSRNPKLDNG